MITKNRIYVFQNLSFIVSGWFVAISLISYPVLAEPPNFQFSVDNDLLVVGPIDMIDTARKTVRVLGQVISLPQLDSGVSVGDMVEVTGTITDGGSYKVSSVSYSASTSYVPGATPLYLKGVITSSDSSVATIKVGSLAVNFSSAVQASGVDEFARGKIAAFVGNRFAGLATFYALSAVLTAGTVKLAATSREAPVELNSQMGLNGLVGVNSQMGLNGVVSSTSQVKPNSQMGLNGLVGVNSQMGLNGVVSSTSQVKPNSQMGLNGLVGVNSQMGLNGVDSVNSQTSLNVTGN